MSTVSENCPRCNTSTMSETAYPFIDTIGSPYQCWRYRCECGNIWANEAQREHNNKMYRRARRTAAGGWA